MEQLNAVILAAGKGTRMKSELPKVLHTVLGKPMVAYVMDAARAAGAVDICLVIGYKAEMIRQTMGTSVSYAYQEEQLGTGHAVRCAGEFLKGAKDTLVLCGDTPLIGGKTLARLVACHREGGYTATVLSARVADPTGYGRILREADNTFLKNVEHKDAAFDELLINEINSGIYIFDSSVLYEAVGRLTNDNAQGEYYLPDALKIIKDQGQRVGICELEDSREILGVNTADQLLEAEAVFREIHASQG